jgi:hypothetical protein
MSDDHLDRPALFRDVTFAVVESPTLQKDQFEAVRYGRSQLNSYPLADLYPLVD